MLNNQQVLVFDTSVATSNLGDLIIMDAVWKELAVLFPNAHFLNTSTHEVIGRASYALNKSSIFSFVGGTNLLSSNMNSYNQWEINWFDALFLKDIILMGVGWWQYQKKPNIYTGLLYRRILHRELMHSVRDEYTKKQLFSIGIKNVINTGCPTMWKLTPKFCNSVPTMKAQSVVFTLTDYNKDCKKDIFLIETLRTLYDSVYFWPQGVGDLAYMDSLGQKGVHILSPNLNSYDKLLYECDSLDYIGTRLHAGIRALQHKRRSIIIAVDNRAIEIHKDTNIPIISRSEIYSLSEVIKSEIKTEISLKESNIKKWKAQFEVYNESIIN